MAKEVMITICELLTNEKNAESVLKERKNTQLENISFKAEPTNVHDKNAVQVYMNGVFVGYVVANPNLAIGEAILAHDFVKVCNPNFNISVKSLADETTELKNCLYYTAKVRVENVVKKKAENEEPKVEEGENIKITLSGSAVGYPGRGKLIQMSKDGDVTGTKLVLRRNPEDPSLIEAWYKDDAVGKISTTEKEYPRIDKLIKNPIIVKLEGFTDKNRVIISIPTASTSIYEKQIKRITEASILTREEINERIEYLEDIGESADFINLVLAEIKEVPEEVKERLLKPKALFKDPNNQYVGKSLDYLMLGANLSLCGPKATGKNTFTETLAWLRNRPLFENNICEDTTEEALKGGKVFESDDKGNMKLVHEMVQLRIWAKYGGDYILDEANMGRPSIMAVINALADERRRYELPGVGVEYLNPDCRLIMTMNDDSSYAGVSEQNVATKSRFTPIRFEWMEDIQEILKEMVKAKGFDPEETNMKEKIAFCQNLHEEILEEIRAEHLPESAVDMRGYSVALRARNFKTGLIDNVAMKGDSPEEREFLKDMICDKMPEIIEGARRGVA